MIPEEELKRAAADFDREMMDIIPDSYHHDFSPKFERKMKPLLRRGKHPQAFFFAKAAACFLLVVLLAGAALVTFSPEVRASVAEAFTAAKRWIRGEQQEAPGYYYYIPEDEDTGGTYLVRYQLTEIPEGYQVDREGAADTDGYASYSNGTEKGFLKFNYFAPASPGMGFVPAEATEYKTGYVRGHEVDLYLAEKPEGVSVIVWVDPETGYLISIGGVFTEEELLELASGVERITE